MATIEEGVCRDDNDCSEKQYCYHTSQTCVDYTDCSRYNRQENAEKKSRHPSMCGPCLPGYTAEKLGTGEVAVVCRKTNTQQDIPEVGRLQNGVIIYAAIGVSLILFLILLGFVVRIFKRRASKRQGRNLKCIAVPTAPPLENNPFIDNEGAACLVPLNNNKNLKDKNNLVRAAVSAPPSWVRTNPNYENDTNNDNTDAVEQLQSTVEFPTDDQSNSWAPEQLTLQVANGNLVGYELGEMDNGLNSILIEANNPSSSEANEEESHNNSSNSNGSASESNNAQGSRERVRASNILISQKISMNVNVLNNDC